MDKLRDPRAIRLVVYAIALIVGVVGVVTGVVDHTNVAAWVSDDGVVGYISLAVVSLLAGANINPKEAPEVTETKKTVEELADIRRRMAG